LNLSEPYSAWWCCLRPTERNMIVLLTGAWFTNNEYVTQATFTIFAVSTGLAASINMDAYFVDHYGLTAGAIVDEEDLPVAVYFFDTTLWPLLYAFSFESGYLCTSKCKLLTFPL